MVAARYCLHCGAAMKLQPVGDRIRPVCPSCGYIHYVNPIVAAGTLVDDDGRLLLVRRGVEPGRGQWGLPAGFGEEGESPEETAIRETREETGVEVAIDELLGVYAFGDQFVPSGVLILFAAHRMAGEPVAGDDAADVGLFAADELPEQIAFRNHREAIAQWARARAIRYAAATPENQTAVWREIRPLASAWQATNGDAPDILTPQDDQTAVVARDRGQSVGFALLQADTAPTMALTAIYVDPAYRRWGIGTQLLAASLTHAREQGASTLRARISTDSPALTLFLGAGYSICGYVQNQAGTWLDLCQAVAPEHHIPQHQELTA